MLAFVHIRKTGGSTIDTMLRQSYGCRHLRVRLGPGRARNPIATASELKRCQWVYWRIDAVSGHGIVPFADLHKLAVVRYFTFLRNPLTRCASDYQFRVVRGGLSQPFERWIKHRWVANQQCKKLCGIANANAAIEAIHQHSLFVGLLEQFDPSLVCLQRWADDPRLDIRYQPKNVTRNANIKQQLLRTSRTRRLLEQANREDMQLYDYVQQEYFPAICRAFGPTLDQRVAEFKMSNRPLPIYPRQLGSTFLREAVYKPIAPWLRERDNPDVDAIRAA